MIVTRRRAKKPEYGRLLLPLLALAALAGALWWPPSHNIIANGPLKPAWTVLGAVGSQAAKPFSFVVQEQAIADQNRKLKEAADLREADRKDKESKDKQISALQAQITQIQSVPQATPAPVPALKTTSAGGTGIAAASAPVSDDIRRTAAYWSSMDAEKAAAIAQKLPDDYVNRVFSQMSPDVVGDIMNELPAKTAARLAASAGPGRAGP
ncbi:MAG: hypothetical protein WCE44_10925 [Candidatus Velthaea sp.]